MKERNTSFSFLIFFKFYVLQTIIANDAAKRAKKRSKNGSRKKRTRFADSVSSRGSKRKKGEGQWSLPGECFDLLFLLKHLLLLGENYYYFVIILFPNLIFLLLLFPIHSDYYETGDELYTQPLQNDSDVYISFVQTSADVSCVFP